MESDQVVSLERIFFLFQGLKYSRRPQGMYVDKCFTSFNGSELLDGILRKVSLSSPRPYVNGFLEACSQYCFERLDANMLGTSHLQRGRNNPEDGTNSSQPTPSQNERMAIAYEVSREILFAKNNSIIKIILKLTPQ